MTVISYLDPVCRFAMSVVFYDHRIKKKKSVGIRLKKKKIYIYITYDDIIKILNTRMSRFTYLSKACEQCDQCVHLFGISTF